MMLITPHKSTCPGSDSSGGGGGGGVVGKNAGNTSLDSNRDNGSIWETMAYTAVPSTTTTTTLLLSNTSTNTLQPTSLSANAKVISTTHVQQRIYQHRRCTNS
uniref:Sphingoid long chain base kinase 5 n=1 Tax=Lygus hesperus TaxID=30085 RepID=A0A0A9VVK7_LYGHE